jgi:hypothetical protein
MNMHGREWLDLLQDDPPDTRWYRWGAGVCFPVVLVIGAAKTLVYQQVTWRVRHRSLDLAGTDAVWFGIALLGAAVFAHCHFFWTHHPRLAELAVLGKLISLLAFIAGLAAVLFSQMRVI